MKTISLLLIGMLFLLCACSEVDEVGFVDVKSTPQQPGNNLGAPMNTELIPIAEFNPTSQKWQLNFNKLVKKFEDGRRYPIFRHT